MQRYALMIERLRIASSSVPEEEKTYPLLLPLYGEGATLDSQGRRDRERSSSRTRESHGASRNCE